MSQAELVWESKPKKQDFVWLFVFPILGVPLGIASFGFLTDGHIMYAGVSGLFSFALIWSAFSTCLPSVIRSIQGRPYTAITRDGIAHGWKVRDWKDVEEVAYRIKEPSKMVFLGEGQKELFSIDLSDGSNRDYDEAHVVAHRVIRKIQDDAASTKKQLEPKPHWGDATSGRF